MAWTYTATPATVPLDAMRLLIGDTDPDDPQLQDAELLYLMGTLPTAAAAAQACDALASRYARFADRTVGDISVSSSQRAQAYREMAANFRNRRKARGVRVLCGGQSVAEKQAAAMDASRVQPAFARGQWDAPGAAQPSNDGAATCRPRGW